MMETVLLVEDSKFLKIAHERVLTRAGYKVITAADGEEALKIVRQTSPNVILLDMLLPRLSGQDVLRALKSDPATTHIPVIIVTSLSKRNAEKLEGAGADGFIEKEALLENPQPLLESIERILRRVDATKSPVSPAPELTWTGEPGASAGFTEVCKLDCQH